ncbi:hypothetical protein [Nocardia spumae]|uniref:hypothetical protein n=1 Tax=Nocardia spumae TaxID=2887190 RepID=UPI001D14EA01|nr:hypothetical protein [Nocardia spumae]
MNLTINGHRLRARSGLTELVVEHDIDGRVHITVHDATGPGNTADFNQADSDVIADFIKGGQP